jgi:hypothetical protein
MPDYQKSKIYRLVCNITGKQYIGSTVSTLSKRKGQHKDKFKSWKEGKYHYVSSFEVIENNDFDIVLKTIRVVVKKHSTHEKDIILKTKPVLIYLFHLELIKNGTNRIKLI